MRKRRKKVLQSDQILQSTKKCQEDKLLEWMSERANGWQPQQLKLHMFSVSDSKSPGVSFQLRGLMTGFVTWAILFCLFFHNRCCTYGFMVTWGNYQLVNYFLPISHYNWQWKVICPFNEFISFNSVFCFSFLDIKPQNGKETASLSQNFWTCPPVVWY